MAVVLQTIKDSDFEHVVKVTFSSTNSAASIVDASGLAGADTNPRLSIVGCSWSSDVNFTISFDADADVVALSLNGSGKIGFGDGVPSIANNAGTGVTGDIVLDNGSSGTGFVVLKLRKESGYDNLT